MICIWRIRLESEGNDQTIWVLTDRLLQWWLSARQALCCSVSQSPASPPPVNISHQPPHILLISRLLSYLHLHEFCFHAIAVFTVSRVLYWFYIRIIKYLLQEEELVWRVEIEASLSSLMWGMLKILNPFRKVTELDIILMTVGDGRNSDWGKMKVLLFSLLLSALSVQPSKSQKFK